MGVDIQGLDVTKEDLVAIKKFIMLIRKLEGTGILDALIDLLEPNVISAFMKFIMHPGLLRMLDNFDKISIN